MGGTNTKLYTNKGSEIFALPHCAYFLIGYLVLQPKESELPLIVLKKNKPSFKDDTELRLGTYTGFIANLELIG